MIWNKLKKNFRLHTSCFQIWPPKYAETYYEEIRLNDFYVANNFELFSCTSGVNQPWKYLNLRFWASQTLFFQVLLRGQVKIDLELLLLDEFSSAKKKYVLRTLKVSNMIIYIEYLESVVRNQRYTIWVKIINWSCRRRF